MKNFLALDTSNHTLSVVAQKDGKSYSAFIPDCAMKQSTLFMDQIDKVLTQAKLSLAECDFFSAVVGAGSFTGIRIGISAIKAFALAYQKPTLPITSFETLAYNGIEGNKNKVLCLINALHDYYYVCGYVDGKQSIAPSYVVEEEVLKMQSEGYLLRASEKLPIQAKAEVEYCNPTQGLLSAVLEKSKDSTAFGELTALYVRKSSAELNLCR